MASSGARSNPTGSVPSGLTDSVGHLLDQLRHCADHLPVGHANTVATIIQALAGLSRPEHATVKIACDFELCRYYYITGMPLLGLDHGVEGVELARALGDLPARRRLLNAYGLLLTDALNLPAAAEVFCEALDVCDELDEPLHFALVWCSISGMLLYAGMPSPAIKAADATLSYLVTVPASNERDAAERTALTNIAYACLDTGQYGLGLRCATKLRASSRSSTSEQSSAFEILQTAIEARNLARLYLRVGDVESARKHVARALDLATSHGACARTARCGQVALGLLEAYTGSFAQGELRIRACLAESRLSEPGVQGTHLHALVEACVVAGLPEEAESYQVELGNVVRNLKTENLLFHHSRHLRKCVEADGANSDPKPPMVFRGLRAQACVATTKARREEVLENLSAAAELHDDPSGHHAHRVSKLATLLAERINSEAAVVSTISSAALLHDIGKVAIPGDLLSKKGTLTEAETTIVRAHAAIGADLLKSTGLPCLEMATQVARHHHEFWNGAGYPDGLMGEAIPLPARLVSIAEAFDAMTHDRPYRPRLSVARALEVITERCGHQFDPALVGPFKELILELQSEHADIDTLLCRDAAASSTFLRAQQRMHERMERVARQVDVSRDSPNN